MTGRPDDPNKRRRTPGSTRPKPRPSQRERSAEYSGAKARDALVSPFDRIAGYAAGVGNTIGGASADVAGIAAATAGFPEFAASMERLSDFRYNRANQAYQQGFSSLFSTPENNYEAEPSEFQVTENPPDWVGAAPRQRAQSAPEPFSREGARDVPVRSLAEMRQALAAERQQNARQGIVARARGELARMPVDQAVPIMQALPGRVASASPEDMARMKMLDMVQGYDEAIASAKTPEEAEALKMQQFSLLERLLGNGDVALSQFLENQ